MDPGADEVRLALGIRAAVRRSRGDQHGAGPDPLAGGRRHVRHPVAQRLEARHGHGRQQLDAVPGRLLREAVGELGTGDALGEPGVVVEALGDPGLAAEGRSLDDEGAGVLPGGVDAGRQSRRAATDDDHVVVAVHRGAAEAELLRQLLVRGLRQEAAVREHDRRDDLLAVVHPLDDLRGLGVLLEVDVGERDALLGQEGLRPPAVGAPRRAVQDDLVVGHAMPSVSPVRAGSGAGAPSASVGRRPPARPRQRLLELRRQAQQQRLLAETGRRAACRSAGRRGPWCRGRLMAGCPVVLKTGRNDSQRDQVANVSRGSV